MQVYYDKDADLEIIKTKKSSLSDMVLKVMRTQII